MVREAAQRHGIASEDVEECVRRVFMGAAELATLVNYDISYEVRRVL
jgi:pyrroline-5-carboxylate reductase